MGDSHDKDKTAMTPALDDTVILPTFQCYKNVNKSSQRLPNTPICQHQWMPC